MWPPRGVPARAICPRPLHSAGNAALRIDRQTALPGLSGAAQRGSHEISKRELALTALVSLSALMRAINGIVQSSVSQANERQYQGKSEAIQIQFHRVHKYNPKD